MAKFIELTGTFSDCMDDPVFVNPDQISYLRSYRSDKDHTEIYFKSDTLGSGYVLVVGSPRNIMKQLNGELSEPVEHAEKEGK